MLSARPATPADYEHFARLFPELGVADPVPDAARWAHELAPETLILETDGLVIAYAYAQALKDVGYVRHVVVQPDRRGRGIGRTIMAAVARRLRAAGCSRWCLNVKPTNTAAIRLYESAGMKVAYASTSLRFAWDILGRLPPPDCRVTARPPQPAEDAAIEAAFDLPQGQIAHSRANPALMLVRLVDVAAPAEPRVGFARFDPAFPGAFPFRVARPALAAALLEALRPHALPDLAFMQVVVEDDPPLSLALVSAGAHVQMDALHMRGTIPEG